MGGATGMRALVVSKKGDAETPDTKPENLTPTPERKMGKRREREEKKGNGSFPILKQTRLLGVGL